MRGGHPQRAAVQLEHRAQRAARLAAAGQRVHVADQDRQPGQQRVAVLAARLTAGRAARRSPAPRPAACPAPGRAAAPGRRPRCASPKWRSTSCRQITSASAAASSRASRGRSCRPSSPTPWWVLNVTSRTGMGGWSGPGAGLVMRPACQSLRRAACRAPAAGPADRARSPTAGTAPRGRTAPARRSGCRRTGRPACPTAAALGSRLRQARQPAVNVLRPPAPADPEADADRVRRLVVQRGDRQLVHPRGRVRRGGPARRRRRGGRRRRAPAPSPGARPCSPRATDVSARPSRSKESPNAAQCSRSAACRSFSASRPRQRALVPHVERLVPPLEVVDGVRQQPGQRRADDQVLARPRRPTAASPPRSSRTRRRRPSGGPAPRAPGRRGCRS